MKALILLLLAAFTLHAEDVRTVKTDIRLVGTTRVDLTPIHQWMDRNNNDAEKSKKQRKSGPTTDAADRPMKEWKFVTVETIQPTTPWATCYIQIDRKEHTTVYMKNIPADIVQHLNDIITTESQVKALSADIESDKTQLRQADAVLAQRRSEFAANRRQLRANLGDKEDQLKKLNNHLKDLKTNQQTGTSDFAISTGQVYNKLEVMDFGLKQK